VEENRLLRAQLEKDVDALSADQVAALRRQYEEVRAVAASNGLEMDPLPAAAAPAARTPGAAAGAGARTAAGPVVAATTGPEAVADDAVPVPGKSSVKKGKATTPGTAAAAAAAGRVSTSASPSSSTLSSSTVPDTPAVSTPEPAAPARKVVVSEADHWIDERGRSGGEDADRLTPRLSAAQQVRGWLYG